MAIPEHGPYRRQLLRIGPQDSGHHPWETNGWCWPRFLGEFIIPGFSRCSSPKMASFRFGGFYQKRNFQVGKSVWKYISDWKKSLTDGVFSWVNLGQQNLSFNKSQSSPQWPGTDGSVTIFSYLREGGYFSLPIPAGCGAGLCRGHANPPILDWWLF